MTAGSDGAIKNRGWIEAQLEKADFVDWDRFVAGDWYGHEQYVNLYGWIDRDDEYKDFVVFILWPENETIFFTTSSEEFSAELNRRLFGSTDGHSDCRRIEDSFDVENAIELQTHDSS